MFGLAVCFLQASALRLGQPQGFLQSGSTYFQKGLADLGLSAAEVVDTPSAAPAVPADVSMEAQAIAAIAMANNMSVAAAKAKLEKANLIVDKVKEKAQERYDAARIAVAEGITEAEAFERIEATKYGNKAPTPAKENPVKAALAKAAPAKAKTPKEATPAKENPVKAALAKAAPAKKASPAKAAAPAKKESPSKKAVETAHKAEESHGKAREWHRGKGLHHKSHHDAAAKQPAHHDASAKLDAATRRGHQMATSKMHSMAKAKHA